VFLLEKIYSVDTTEKAVNVIMTRVDSHWWIVLYCVTLCQFQEWNGDRL